MQQSGTFLFPRPTFYLTTIINMQFPFGSNCMKLSGGGLLNWQGYKVAGQPTARQPASAVSIRRAAAAGPVETHPTPLITYSATVPYIIRTILHLKCIVHYDNLCTSNPLTLILIQVRLESLSNMHIPHKYRFYRIIYLAYPINTTFLNR